MCTNSNIANLICLDNILHLMKNITLTMIMSFSYKILISITTIFYFRIAPLSALVTALA